MTDELDQAEGSPNYIVEFILWAKDRGQDLRVHPQRAWTTSPQR